MSREGWGGIALIAALALAGCAQPVSSPAPTDSLCVAVGELHFSEQALNAMTPADIARFDHYNETWDARCKS